MTRTRAAAFAFLLALHPAPTLPAEDVPPFAQSPTPDQLAEEEGRVWAEAGEFDKALRRQGSLFPDPAVGRYLQETMDSLFPEFRGALRVRVINDTTVNAFALPNGSLYINMGLLARLENEAQIATVLAHEGGHFVARHGYQQRQNLKGASAMALSLGLAGGPVGSLLGGLAAVSSVYGYSRDHEREADRISFERLQRAGYDPRAGARVFVIMDEEAKLQNFKEPVFFASHPRMQERIESFNELAARAPEGGKVGAEAFLARTAPVRPAWMEAELGLARYKSLILQLSKEDAETRFGPRRGYYLAEAYRLRGEAEAEDEARAETGYRQALAADPGFAPSYRGLGLLLYRRQDLAGAHQMLDQYLQVAPAAGDQAYVREYLNRINEEAGAVSAPAQ